MVWTQWEKVTELDFQETIPEKKLRERGGGVFRLSFNRPERMNPMTDQGWEEVCLAMNYAGKADDIGVIVFAGRVLPDLPLAAVVGATNLVTGHVGPVRADRRGAISPLSRTGSLDNGDAVNNGCPRRDV